MPLLDSEAGDSEMEEVDQRGSQTCRPGCVNLSLDRDGDGKTGGEQKEEETGFSFSLDLGPSILDDVLQVMDKLHQ